MWIADNWKDWMSLKLSKIEPMDLMVAVSELKPGGYTRPTETDEGLVIVKLLERDDDFCSLARILVRMGEEAACYEPGEHGLRLCVNGEIGMCEREYAVRPCPYWWTRPGDLDRPRVPCVG